ncbi:MAG: hypothetical protein ACRDQ7_21020 [Haloechinothrix sp.]
MRTPDEQEEVGDLLTEDQLRRVAHATMAAPAATPTNCQTSHANYLAER